MNDKQYEALRESVTDWNQWRQDNQGVKIDLQGANLQCANLWRADLQYANLQGADLEGAKLKGAKLKGADLRDSDLQEADLQEADLRGAYLRGSDLRKANLWFANLRGAYLVCADLEGADLRGSDLLLADLEGANFKGANLNWQSHELICEVLRQHADGDKDKLEHIQFILENKHAYCWEEYCEVLPKDFVQWGLGVLAEYVQARDDLPKELSEYIERNA